MLELPQLFHSMQLHTSLLIFILLPWATVVNNVHEDCARLCLTLLNMLTLSFSPLVSGKHLPLLGQAGEVQAWFLPMLLKPAPELWRWAPPSRSASEMPLALMHKTFREGTNAVINASANPVLPALMLPARQRHYMKLSQSKIHYQSHTINFLM